MRFLGTSSNVLPGSSSVAGTLGWGSYVDSQHTSADPFDLAANVDTLLPNDAQGVGTIAAYKPADVTTFYDGTAITGRQGEGALIQLEFKAIPDANNAYLEIWFDIGGGIPPLYRSTVTFPRGAGQVRTVALAFAAYTLGTWQANGGAVMVRGNVAIELFDIRYIIHRLSKA